MLNGTNFILIEGMSYEQAISEQVFMYEQRVHSVKYDLLMFDAGYYCEACKAVHSEMHLLFIFPN